MCSFLRFFVTRGEHEFLEEKGSVEGVWEELTVVPVGGVVDLLVFPIDLYWIVDPISFLYKEADCYFCEVLLF